MDRVFTLGLNGTHAGTHRLTLLKLNQMLTFDFHCTFNVDSKSLDFFRLGTAYFPESGKRKYYRHMELRACW